MCQSKENGGRRCNGHQGSYYSSSALDKEMVDTDTKTVKIPQTPAQALHVMSYAAQGYVIDDEVIEAAKSFDISTLSPKQQWVTWNEFALAQKPSEGLKTLYKMGHEPYYKELHAIRGVPQEPSWHPEGPVEKHTQEAADKAATYAKEDRLNKKDTQIAVFGAMVHDFGKSTHTQITKEKISSKGHDVSGAPKARDFLTRIGAPEHMKTTIPTLVSMHMCHAQKKTTMKALRNIYSKLEKGNATMDQLVRVMNADIGGRSTASEPRCDDYWEGKRKELIKHEEQMEAERKAKILPISADDFEAKGYDRRTFGELFKNSRFIAMENPGITKEQLLHKIQERFPLPNKDTK